MNTLNNNKAARRNARENNLFAPLIMSTNHLKDAIHYAVKISKKDSRTREKAFIKQKIVGVFNNLGCHYNLSLIHI